MTVSKEEQASASDSMISYLNERERSRLANKAVSQIDELDLHLGAASQDDSAFHRDRNTSEDQSLFVTVPFRQHYREFDRKYSMQGRYAVISQKIPNASRPSEKTAGTIQELPRVGIPHSRSDDSTDEMDDATLDEEGRAGYYILSDAN